MMKLKMTKFISGYYCESTGMNDYTTFDCPVGHYCLEGTTSRTSYPCPGIVVFCII